MTLLWQAIAITARVSARELEVRARANTVHLSILIAFLMLMGGKGLLVRRRSG